MSSVCSRLALVGAACACLGAAVPSPQPLRVCADPNNLPFSNQRREGFENRIAVLVAGELHRPLDYFWLPQRRGFIRNSLNAGRCDVVIGVPAHYGLLQPTRTYYRSSYAFVSRRDRHLHIDSFDSGALRALTIGIQISGDDYNNPPAAQALAVRHIIENVRGFPIYGDYSRPDPQREIVDAVADGRVDVAVVWGPLAGYYASREPRPLTVTPMATERDGPVSALAFDIAMGVRRDDRALKTALDDVIGRRGSTIRQILRSYGVPLR
jgi:mxaJ protein